MARNATQTQTAAQTTNAFAVTFLHPREGSEFEADISAATTGQNVIDGLVQERFIDAPSDTVSYALQCQRTGKSLPLSTSLLTAGVQASDRVAVVATQSGN